MELPNSGPTRPQQGILGLRRSDLDSDPIVQFGRWFEQALSAGLAEPNAMILATANAQGVPSARVVLLKAFDAHGFVFFTNYESQKGHELAENSHAALVFFWPALERQVRITGVAAHVSREESDHYFHSRPVGSQIGAWASHQSQVLLSREELDTRFAQLAVQFQNQAVPLPPYWGGYRVTPNMLEFWQARVSRLHDRFRYTRAEDGAWRMDRLSP